MKKFIFYFLTSIIAGLIMYFGGQIEWYTVLVMVLAGLFLYAPYHYLIGTIFPENPTPFQKIYRQIFLVVSFLIIFAKIGYYIFDKI